MGDRLAKKIRCIEDKGVTKMESMRYCAVENTARAVEELFDRIEREGEDLLKRLGSYEKPCLFKLISHVHSWHHLSQLPDEIATALIDLAIANRGCGYPAIAANYKLDRLASMSHPEIIQAWNNRE